MPNELDAELVTVAEAVVDADDVTVGVGVAVSDVDEVDVTVGCAVRDAVAESDAVPEFVAETDGVLDGDGVNDGVRVGDAVAEGKMGDSATERYTLPVPTVDGASTVVVAVLVSYRYTTDASEESEFVTPKMIHTPDSKWPVME